MRMSGQPSLSKSKNPQPHPRYLRVQAQSGLEGGVFEVPVALIVIERRRVAGEIGLDDVEIAVEIVIGGRDAHAGLRLAVGAEHAACFQPDLDELAVLLVLVQQRLSGIVGDVDVGPAVVVEVRDAARRVRRCRSPS